MLSKDRYKTTSGLFVIQLLSQLWEEKNFCERRNELRSWMAVALPNRHIHLCLFKLGFDEHALPSSVMYILSGENITAVYPMSWRRWDQNTTQVDNRLDSQGLHTVYVRLLLISSMLPTTGRQLRPISSVLYRIISKRRYILAAQLLLKEKSGT
jgi:hypothetical protein